MPTLVDGVSFNAASSGTGTFVFGSSRASFRTLAQANSDELLVDGNIVSYLAQDSLSSPTQREWGHGTYSVAGNSIARTTVLGGTSGPGTAVAFSTAPIVSLTALAEDFSLPIAGANKTYYQNYSTGSNSNPGTAALPFKTVQFAANIIANWNYAGGFSPTLNMAAQTDSETGNDLFDAIVLPPLYPLGTRGRITGAGVGSTNIDDTGGYGAFSLRNSSWIIDSLTIDSGFNAIAATGAGASYSSQGGALAIGDSTASGFLTPFSINNLATGSINSASLTITGTVMTTLLHVFNNSYMDATSAVVTLPAAISCGFSFLESEFNSATAWAPTSVSNSGGVTGPAVFALGGCSVATMNGLISDIPGSASTSLIDATSGIMNQVTGFGTGAGFVTKGASRGHVDQAGNLQTGSSYTAVLIDAGNVVEISNAGANTFTVPTHASVAFPLWTKITVVQAGAGATTISGAGGVTVHNSGVIGGQWKSAAVYQRATDDWVQLNGAF